MRSFVSAAGQQVGLPFDKAELLAMLLVENDLRGVFSHGTTQIATYAMLMRDGKLNPKPDVRVIKETPVSLIVDGDGGLGYFPSYEGTQLVIAKAKQAGIAVMLSRNHGHFGAAGIYARMTLGHDLLCYVTSGHQLHLTPGQPIYDAAAARRWRSPRPPPRKIRSCSTLGRCTIYTVHRAMSLPRSRRDWCSDRSGSARSARPGAVCCPVFGSIRSAALELAGRQPGGARHLPAHRSVFRRRTPSRAQMDAFVRRVRELQPLAGFDRSLMPGGIEAERELEYRTEGIPVGPDHRQRLDELARTLGIATPW